MRILAISLAVAGVLHLGQEQERPVFRSGVSLVRLDVRIVDAAGQPISDIKPEEIQISESGTTRPLLLFQRVAGAGRSYVEMAQRTIASDVSTNQGAPQGQLYVLVFDQDHIRPGGELPARLAAEAFLRARVRPQDRVAIFGLPGPGPSQPFTANLASARQQLEYVRGGLVRLASGAVTEMPERDAYEIVRGNEAVLTRYTTVQSVSLQDSAGGAGTDVARRVFEDPAVLRRLIWENAQTIVNRTDSGSRFFLKAFADLLRSFKGIDGRKTVVLFSEGFYGDNVSRDLEDVAAAAAESYSAIYALDLNKRQPAVDAVAPADDGGEINSRLEPLGSLAAETSGALLKDASTRLDSALASLQPDDGSYYLLGFEPGLPTGAEGTYRRVSVRVRRSGAKVVTRTGYALGTAPTPADRRRAIDTALAAPFTQQGLKVEYTTYIGHSINPAAQRVVLSLTAELPLRRSGGSGGDPADVADVVFAVRDVRNGNAVASGRDQLPLPERASAGWSTGSTPWHVAFDVPAGDYIMRCVVREPGGIIGSADRRFTVHALNGPDVTSSDFIVPSAGDALPVRATAYVEQPLTGTLRLFGPTAASLESAVAHLELTAAGDASGSTSRVSAATIGEVVSSGTRVMRDVLFSVPLDRLDAGPYIARAVVRVNGELVADLRRPVDLVLGRAPAVSPTRADRPRASAVLDGEVAQRLARRVATNAADDPVRRGLTELSRERYVEAATLLGTAFDASPNDAALAFVLGWARVGAGDRTGAITAFRNACRTEPSMVPSYLAMAQTYVELGHAELAVQALEEGLKAAPQSIELARMLSTLKK